MKDNDLITILIPAFNEEEVLQICHDRVAKVMAATGHRYEILYVNDGSQDKTWELMCKIRREDTHVSIINLSRNFGKEHAMAAGLKYASGDAIVIIDADLQDPPELIPDMIALWKQGYDTVYGHRRERDGESAFKKITSFLFYRFISKVSHLDIPRDTGDFRLLSRRSTDALLKLNEQHRFMKGLFAWIGFKQTELIYDRDRRAAGKTKFNYWKLWNFALEGITSFTTAPLRLASYVGAALSFTAFSYGLFLLCRNVFTGNPFTSYQCLLLVVLFIGGIQLIFIGILGEYLGRTSDEVKKRPLYYVDRFMPFNKPERHPKTDDNSHPQSVKFMQSILVP